MRIIADNDPPDPRNDWDQSTILCCDHRRYSLGDDGAHSLVADLIRASGDYRVRWEAEDGDALDFSDGPDLWRAVQRCHDIVALPCFLYDHSGITMSTSPFSCPWDSGQVGFICIGKAALLERFQRPPGSRLSSWLKVRARDLLQSDVGTYDQYLTGDVWGYVIDLDDGDDLPDNQPWSCWGLYGIGHVMVDATLELQRAVTRFPHLVATPG